MNAPFDTLQLADELAGTRLGKAGAEKLARAMADIAMKDVATKADIREAVHTMTVRLGAMIVGAAAVLSVFISRI